MKTGVFLINLGTPEGPSVGDVREYLREFLMDQRVMDIPSWQRFLLVHLIIAPFRAPRLAKSYRKLWLAQGAPLKIYGRGVQRLLQQALGDDFEVFLAMRYQNPSIGQVLGECRSKNLKRLIVLPLYPQYAGASSASSIEKVFEIVHDWGEIPEIKVVSRFFDHPLFIRAFAALGRAYMLKNSYDHYLFSYHGLPEDQVLKASHDHCRLDNICCSVYKDENQDCYRAQCYQTTRLLAKELGLKEGDYTVCFQSRLGMGEWLKPYMDCVVRQLPTKGIKKVLIFSPSFVADCLETSIEVGVEYKRLFLECGGDHWQLVESLNTQPLWIECLKDMVLQGRS